MFLVAGILSGACSFAGCGTILYPERRGQHAGTLDTGVVVLDGLGLLLFFIPGVIAFAVDFATGAIYLPERSSQDIPLTGKSRKFQSITLASNQLSRPQIAAAVSRHTGREIHLEEGQYCTAKLRDLDHFWPATENLLAEYRVKPNEEVVRAQSPEESAAESRSKDTNRPPPSQTDSPWHSSSLP